MRIQKILAELYPFPPIPLPHEDPFTLLVAVVLSAQCTDARVNEVAPRLFARAVLEISGNQTITSLVFRTQESISYWRLHSGG